MRAPILATVAALGCLISVASRAAVHVRNVSITQLPYPAEVSLVQEPTGWTFRQSPTNLPLYLYEPRTPGSALCNRACEAQWMPLLAPAGERALGDWTILVRADGRRQWAFEQHPVYTHRHDTPDHAAGSGVGGAWHLMPHFSS